MPNTRKKVIKTVYKDEDDSEAENLAGDFSDSGSDAKISEQSSSEDDYVVSDASSGQEFHKTKKKRFSNPIFRRPKFAKEFINKIQNISLQKETAVESDGEPVDNDAPVLFSVKDLTDADKLLPSVLNLSESDSSEDESPRPSTNKHHVPVPSSGQIKNDSDDDTTTEYKDVWSNNLQYDSEEIAKKTFVELEQHKSEFEETKASISNYASKIDTEKVSDVKDLLAQGEEVLPQPKPTKKSRKLKKLQDDSDSEMEDWEEVKDAKTIPQQGLELVIDLPDAVCRKRKTIDVEMMMKRKINRVKKEHQVYLHKVHVLCWIGHGNFVSRVLNDQHVMAAALSLVPSKECYPGERVDMKYVEQITTWYKDKLTLKPDKNEDKFRPKAPPLKDILLAQTKRQVVTSKKYLVFIFVSMLRALGLQSRVMFNFLALPIKPPTSELCSLSTKTKDETASNSKVKQDVNIKSNSKKNNRNTKSKAKKTIPQVDGQDDTFIAFENILQLDGNNDAVSVKKRSVITTKAKKTNANNAKNEDVSPPKRARKSPSPEPNKNCNKIDENVPGKGQRSIRRNPNSCKGEELKLGRKSTNNNQQQPKASQSRRPKTSDNSAKEASIKTKAVIANKPATQCEPPKPVTLRNLRKRSTTDSINSATIATESKLPKKDADSKSFSVGQKKLNVPKIIVTNPEGESKEVMNTSKYFQSDKSSVVTKNLNPIKHSPRKLWNNAKPTTSQNADKKGFQSDKSSDVTKTLNRRYKESNAKPTTSQNADKEDDKLPVKHTMSRSKRALGEKSKYFNDTVEGKKNIPAEIKELPKITQRQTKQEERLDDNKRVSHRDLPAKIKAKKKNDVTADLVTIIKKRVKEAKAFCKKVIVKGNVKNESDDDSDHLPEEVPKRRNSESDEDFKPTKISPKPSTSRKIDRRVISSDDDTPKNKIDVWCEVFVEELEQWVVVDVITGKAHCTNEVYNRATHPMCYTVGWDNNNYLKDLTRRYVPHWNTVTRKQRAEPAWWAAAIGPWRGPETARDREEDDQLNRMQLDAPLPKSIAEYKNHPLYALKRHLLKFEAIYPPDAASLGFVRNEPVYARECVHVCRSRDTWLKEAKVVRIGEQPYKVVKARPKWDKLSNKLITDKPLEVFGPWQVQDYEPPVAVGGVVPRNAYGNVELFKECMLPKGTVHIKLPGLNRVAKKLSIDCAPAMTGFDFNGGWSHPVYDGFVVCEEFGEIITDAWVKDQEEQERKDREKLDLRVYGNWRRLIKGLLIRERINTKYGFDDPKISQEKKKSKAPRLVVKKRT